MASDADYTEPKSSAGSTRRLPVANGGEGPDQDGESPASARRRPRIGRTLVIGLDGCSWNVLDPLIASGELPNLQRLREEGASGILESTIPFYTGPAWTSYATGCSPAAHGVYDFMMLRGDDRLTVASQDDLRRPAYYQQLGAEGRRSVLVNLPLDQNGCRHAVIVNSWLTDDDARRILPVSRRSRYERLLDAYRTFPEEIADVGDLCALEQARFDLARELFLAEDWDHFFVLFSSSDWAGHSLTGRFLNGDEAAVAALTRLYRQLDRHVGWLVDHASGATITVMSDHGQCEETAVLRVNSLLRQLGLLSVQERKSEESPFFIDKHGRRNRRVKLPLAVSRYRGNRLVRPVGLAAKRLLARSLGIDVVPSVPRLDRVGSAAFMPTDASFAVYVRNSQNGYPQAIREALAQVELPEGGPALDGVWTVDELYGWPATPDGPTLLFSPALGVRPSAALKEPIVHVPTRPGRGCHQRDGIVIFAGENVRSADLGRLTIYDVAPTVLWSMGAGVPRGLDGRVVFEAFEPAFAAEQPLNEVEPLDLGESSAALGSESGEVTRRLKALGYL